MTRREADVSVLSILDKLLLSQAVYELGANAWPSVAKLLSKHPLLNHRKSFFTPQSCQAFYKTLRSEAALEITEADNAIRGKFCATAPFSVINFFYIAPQNLRLAQIHFHARLLELKAHIGEEEEKFKRTVAEIDEIRNGAKQKQLNPIKVEEVRQAEEVEKIENVTTQEESQPDSTPLPELSEDDASADTELQVAEENDEKELEKPKSPVSSTGGPSPQGIDIDALLVPDPDEDTQMSDGGEQEHQPVEPPEAQHTEFQESPADTNVHLPTTELQQSTTEDDDARASSSVPMDVDQSPKPPAESPKQEAASPKSEQRQDTAQATEPTPDPNATEDEALSSGDEPLHVQRNRRKLALSDTFIAAALRFDRRNAPWSTKPFW
ncbi:hypothetical protein MPER_12433 [Moniliophthora perniciosa FA553]|nr:hypothetical protein MPER_12433 [Moniliophthora perniciosa FA553]